MNKIRLKGENFHYQEVGIGSPVILLHGMGSDHTVWQGLISLLKDNYQMLALDLRGHGQSTKTPGPYSMELFSQDVYHFLESMDIDKAHFIGHSMGGSILLEMAIKHPKMIHSLSLISSFASVDPQLEKTLLNLQKILNQDGFETFFECCLQLAYTPNFIKENRELFSQIRSDMAQEITITSLQDTLNACLEVDLIDSLGNLEIPVLLIAGREDHFTPFHHSQNIKNVISQAQLEVMDGVGHNLLVENATDTGHIIRKFLNSL